MLVAPARFWCRGAWIGLLVLLLSLAPYLTSSTELARMGHALLLDESIDGGFDWTPAHFPESFLLEGSEPHPVFIEAIDRLGLKAPPSD